ncbi:glycosyltransferase, partial [Candidatus Uhrbacteria bacterium]|nr:glycosyltransferase [Candidatus Uhrbacteria bacterium]
MTDLRIVIVSWNVEKLLGRCLLSLPDACGGLAFDVVVVDNASADRSVASARLMGDELGLPMRVIVNEDNRGFAKACNQGLAGFDGRYCLFLNPDTECPPGSLMEFVRAADAHPDVGIAGPRIMDERGRHHPSVRRFPTVWSQAGILLKLHHLLPFLPVFASYYMRDLDIEREQTVDQVEGSCFLVR